MKDLQDPTAPPDLATSSETMHQLNGFRKSSPPQNRKFVVSLMCLRRHMTTPGPNVNFAIFQLGRLLMENSRKYTSLSGSLS